MSADRTTGPAGSPRAWPERTVLASGPVAPRRVVVGVDGTPESLEAARYAAAEAEVRGLDLSVVHACPVSSDRTTAGADARRTTGRAMVDAMLAQVHVGTTTRLRIVIETAPPAALLTAEMGDAALLVLGRHQLDVADGRLSGRVASVVVAEDRHAVVVVPAGWSRTFASTVHLGRKPVVVAVDERGSAASALQVAYDEAELWQSPVLVLHASTAADEQAASARTAAELVAGQRQDHPDIVTEHRVVPSETVLALVEASRGARLLVVGRPHGRHGRRSWRHSVARALLHQSRCPLVVVPTGVEPEPGAERPRQRTPALVS